MSISWIQAVFSPAERATTYSLTPPQDDWPGGAKFNYYWQLELKAVDPAAGVDGGCNNHGVLTGHDATFVWHHGNTGDPVHDDGCNHSLQGKYGHQGLITVTVSDGHGWFCNASYKGTESSDLESVSEGVATLPDCYDRCASFEAGYNRWNPEYQKLRDAYFKLREDIPKAQAALAKAETELKELQDLTHGVEELPYATAAVRKARTEAGELAAKLKPLEKAYEDAATASRSYWEDLEECRGLRRTSGRNPAAGPARTSTPVAACSNEAGALARARGEAAAYKLLARLTVPDLAGSARKLATAARRLQGAGTGPARAKIAAAVASLKRAGAAAGRVAAQAARIRSGAKANARAVTTATAALAKCRAKPG